MNKEEAIAYYESESWKALSSFDRALFQLKEDRLCMPFSVFHEALEEALGSPITALGIAMFRDELISKLEGKKNV